MMPNYERPPFSPCPKGEVRLVAEKAKETKAETADKKGKQAVRDRDKGICRVCGRKATEVHEALTFKSKGGVATLQNSIHVCAKPLGLCHQFLQQHGIRVVGKHCSKKLTFIMSAAIAKLVFGRSEIPAHVRVVRERKKR